MSKPMTLRLFGVTSGQIAWPVKVATVEWRRGRTRLRNGGLLGRKVEIVMHGTGLYPKKLCAEQRNLLPGVIDILYVYGSGSEGFAIVATSKELKKTHLWLTRLQTFRQIQRSEVSTSSCLYFRKGGSVSPDADIVSLILDEEQWRTTLFTVAMANSVSTKDGGSSVWQNPPSCAVRL